METNEKNYDLSFFKPTNPRTKANRNLVIILLTIWIICIFGFQFLLKIIEKPTAEEALNKFNAVKESVLNGNASILEKQDFVWSVLSVLGKTIKPEERNVLDDVLSCVTFQLIPESDRDQIISTLNEIKKSKESLSELSTEEFTIKRNEIREREGSLINKIVPFLGLTTNELRAKLLTVELTDSYNTSPSKETVQKLEGIMNLYLIHNQSVLTDTTFLGFPFHYFYTAVFLLILFIFLCWIYAYRINKLNNKFNFEG